MHPYIPHLLNDITAAHRIEKPCQEREKSFAEILEEISRMKADQKNTFGYFCGLRREDFPQFNYCSMNPSNCLLGQHCTCLIRKASEGGGFIEIKP